VDGGVNVEKGKRKGEGGGGGGVKWQERRNKGIREIQIVLSLVACTGPRILTFRHHASYI